MARKKKEKFPYKFLRPDQLEELQRMTTDDLIKEHLRENKKLKALKRQKKDDHQIADLKKQIDDHRSSHEDQAQVKELQEEIKELKKSIDLEIADILSDKKDLTKGWNDSIKAHQERADVIFKLIDDRTPANKK
jgi:hypothetical protein